MTEEIVASFSKLPIKDASVIAVLAESRSKLVLRLALEDSAARYVDVYELQFTGVADVVIDAVGIPWFGKIYTHKADLAHAADIPSGEPSVTWEGRFLIRFVVSSSRERFEVVAEQYAFARLERMAQVPRRSP
jgi:hypothetical protein